MSGRKKIEYLYGKSGENKYEKIVKQAEANARALKIRLKRPSLSAIDIPVCEENPLGNLYISAEGEVSPCVYLYPPLLPLLTNLLWEGILDREGKFGNIFRDSFSTVWSCNNYEAFRNRFVEREKEFKELYFSLWDSPRIKGAQGKVLPNPPEPCKTCHKILGI